MNSKIYSITMMVLFFVNVSAQNQFILQNNKQDKIHFKLINNLIVVPVEVNGVSLSFLLDTGVSKPLIFNFFELKDDLEINNSSQIFIKGLGDGAPIEALKSEGNSLRIGAAVNSNQDVYVLVDSSINFVPNLGIAVHGIIGYDLFKDFVVELNYSKKYIRLFDPKSVPVKRYKRWSKLPITFQNKKPIIRGLLNLDSNPIPVQLMIDSGGSDALWLFENNQLGLNVSELHIDDFLGKGLAGPVFGKRSIVQSFQIDKYRLNDIYTAFPDTLTIQSVSITKQRNGSLMGGILHRFNWLFDYKNQNVLFKKNSKFKNPFEYNKSGVFLEHSGVRVVKVLDTSKLPKLNTSNQEGARIDFTSNYKLVVVPEFMISAIRSKSPADLAGLKIGDIVISINNNNLIGLSLQKVLQLFYGKDGKLVKMKVNRQGKILNYRFRLGDIFVKKKAPLDRML